MKTQNSLENRIYEAKNIDFDDNKEGTKPRFDRDWLAYEKMMLIQPDDEDTKSRLLTLEQKYPTIATHLSGGPLMMGRRIYPETFPFLRSMLFDSMSWKQYRILDVGCGTGRAVEQARQVMTSEEIQKTCNLPKKVNLHVLGLNLNKEKPVKGHAYLNDSNLIVGSVRDLPVGVRFNRIIANLSLGVSRTVRDEGKRLVRNHLRPFGTFTIVDIPPGMTEDDENEQQIFDLLEWAEKLGYNVSYGPSQYQVPVLGDSENRNEMIPLMIAEIADYRDDIHFGDNLEKFGYISDREYDEIQQFPRVNGYSWQELIDDRSPYAIKRILEQSEQNS